MAKIQASKREITGTRHVRRMRAEGKVPGVLYGHGKETVPLTLDQHDVDLAVTHGERVLELDIQGTDENVLVKEVQYDTFGHELLHVDLARVDLDERVEVSVPVILAGTPEGTRDGGVLQQAFNELNIEVPVRDIPDELRVMVTEMKLDDRLLIKDVELPASATLLDDPDEVLCQVTELAEEPEAAEEGEALAAEPEVIGEVEEGEEPSDEEPEE